MSDEFFVKFEVATKVSRSSDAATFATSVGGETLGCSRSVWVVHGGMI